MQLSKNNQKQLLLVEVNGVEPMTSCVQGRRSPTELHPQHNLLSQIRIFNLESLILN